MINLHSKHVHILFLLLIPVVIWQAGGLGICFADDSHNTMKEEALSGLLVLGFGKAAAEKALDKALKSGEVTDVEGLIKVALKMM